ncbi:hypothetical protein GW537_07325 [Piscirickettsia salmonis]|uniref:hypothetical protein n=1 Tax=Piscirickettsia salmonis TaxID=1238 RepID=UPI000B130681|nr:hypothetical protein [Piscirickettsia salmonis]QHS26049.1 hypothetical protein GW538_09055 [Piscirickettsia salmonis]QHS28966.1 hypothetical protein GW537_07325 [Piscirickettsia salmonis]
MLSTPWLAAYEKNVLKIPIFCGCITRFCCQCVSPGLHDINNEIQQVKTSMLRQNAASCHSIAQFTPIRSFFNSDSSQQ